MSLAPIVFAGAVAAELDPERLDSLGKSEPPESPWRLADPDWDGVESVRLLAARFADGSIAALASARPADANGHDADEVAAVYAARGKAEGVHEALVSTEEDADGRVRRVGVELWSSEEPPPRRLAADRTGYFASAAGGVEHEAVLLEARLDGEPGVALFEILRPAG